LILGPALRAPSPGENYNEPEVQCVVQLIEQMSHNNTIQTTTGSQKKFLFSKKGSFEQIF
jgi:hypothetical protein